MLTMFVIKKKFVRIKKKKKGKKTEPSTDMKENNI